MVLAAAVRLPVALLVAARVHRWDSCTIASTGSAWRVLAVRVRMICSGSAGMGRYSRACKTRAQVQGAYACDYDQLIVACGGKPHETRYHRICTRDKRRTLPLRLLRSYCAHSGVLVCRCCNRGSAWLIGAMPVLLQASNTARCKLCASHAGCMANVNKKILLRARSKIGRPPVPSKMAFVERS